MSYDDIKIDSGKYLKIGSGTTVDLHILSESPVKQIIHGYGQEKLSCTGPNCRLCEDGESPKQRWIINVFDRTDGKVRLFEFGPSIAKQIKAIAELLKESGQTVHDIDIRIKAEGEGLNREYTVMQKPMTAPVPAELILHKIV